MKSKLFTRVREAISFPYFFVLTLKYIDICNTMYYNIDREKGVDIMTVSVRLSDEDTTLIKSYAQIKNVTLSELIRKAILEQIEDEYDLESYNKAIKEYRKNPKTYTLKEIKEELNL